MLSIIISSYKNKLLEAIRVNIEKNIGIPYEIIVIENNAKMGICNAYNLGAEKAIFDLLCFVHEDVEFISNNWGVKIKQLFDDDNSIGLAGFAGSNYKSKFLTGWQTGNSNFDRINLHQKYTEKETIKLSINPRNELYSEVVALDGLCMFTTKVNWLKNKFNESLTGFHFYDLDFTLNTIDNGRKAVVMHNIDVIHFSLGRFNNDWLKEAFKYHKSEHLNKLLENLKLPVISYESERDIKIFWFLILANQDISLYNKLKLTIYYKLLNSKNFIFTTTLFLKLLKNKIDS
ncbi:MAG: hypothetical protein EOP34_06890 [Rickettsiales bacterium]|nr:MAG: hypothetical protein EOP34_06890 [Rickettsiales bacterium]